MWGNAGTRLKGACPCVAAGFWLLLACSPALADDTLSVVLSGRTPALMNALNLVAEGAGFYKEERLTVTRISVNGALEAVQTCSSGKGDICPVGIEPLITNYPDGIRLKMFLSRGRHFAYVIAVPEDSPVRQLADLKGKAIGVHVLGAGASGVFTTASALSAVGLKPADYKFAPIGYEDEAADALASGKVDYNFTEIDRDRANAELPGLSAFVRDEKGQVFHTYSSYSRGPEELIGALMILDRAPKGRNETTVFDWVRRHDEYAAAPAAE